MLSERNKTLAAFPINNNDTNAFFYEGTEDAKIWRPLNADIF